MASMIIFLAPQKEMRFAISTNLQRVENGLKVTYGWILTKVTVRGMGLSAREIRTGKMLHTS